MEARPDSVEKIEGDRMEWVLRKPMRQLDSIHANPCLRITATPGRAEMAPAGEKTPDLMLVQRLKRKTCFHG